MAEGAGPEADSAKPVVESTGLEQVARIAPGEHHYLAVPDASPSLELMMPLGSFSRLAMAEDRPSRRFARHGTMELRATQSAPRE
jgi:hypothetical protein